ncbi:MAG: L-fuculokinase [Candidatus Bathyarchaeia archaeon]
MKLRRVEDQLYLLGLDVGTTGCKSVIFTPSGEVISSSYGEYRLYHRRPEWSELNPEEVWKGIIGTIRSSIKKGKIDPRQIAALGTSVLGEAFFPVDKEGRWLYWSMTTFDARAEEQTRWWEENFGADEMYRITGQPLTSSMPIYVLPKIQWLRENEPELYNKTWMFLCWEDYVNLKLCGRPVMDYSVATRTMMFDIRKKAWSSEILEKAQIDESLLPEVLPSGSVVGEISREAAEETGLSQGTIVVTGGHDQPCGALGAGITETGPAMDATGTVECIAVIQRELTLTEKMRLQGFAVHCYVIDGKYFMFGFNPSGGVILRWFRDNFAEKDKEDAKKMGVDVYDLLTSEASKAPPGSTELFLLPYFEGSGTPTFNRKARGVFLGFTLAHGKREVVRAILEGLTYELRNNTDAIEEHGTEITELRAIGGGAKSKFWLQLKADITGRRVVVPNVTEAAATGAAILASVGGEIYGSVEEAVGAFYSEKETFLPNAETSRIYDRYYRLYKKLYGAFENAFDEIKRLENDRVVETKQPKK